VGLLVGLMDGFIVGAMDGARDGLMDGLLVGFDDGLIVGLLEGLIVGFIVGLLVGFIDGLYVEGKNDGLLDGIYVGSLVGGQGLYQRHWLLLESDLSQGSFHCTSFKLSSFNACSSGWSPFHVSSSLALCTVVVNSRVNRVPINVVVN